MYTLLDRKNRRYLAYQNGEMHKIGNFAVVQKLHEGKIKIGLSEYYVLRSNLYDYMSTIKRKAQVIGIKDAAYIIAKCGIHAGSVIVEGGAGSGSLTTALLYFVYPDGKVYTYEMREDFAKVAKENILRTPYAKNWILKIGNVCKDVEERNIDAFIVDIPEPWDAVETAKKVLKISGCFASYVPTYNQMEKVYRKLENSNFVDLEACEIIKRNMVIGPKGTRPDNVEVPHTGFLIFGRKV